MIYINISLSSTAINTFVTIVSIIFSVLSGLFAYRAKKIKNSIIIRMNEPDLIIYSNDFHNLYTEINRNILTEKSNKGGPWNYLLDKLNDLLVEFNRIEQKLPYEAKKSLRANVDYIKTNIVKIYYCSASETEFKSWKERINQTDVKLDQIIDDIKTR